MRFYNDFSTYPIVANIMIRLFLLLLITSPVFAISSKTIKYKNSKIHVVEFNPIKYDLKIEKALGGGLGREDVLSIAKREVKKYQ